MVACWLATLAGQGIPTTLEFKPHPFEVYPYISHVRITVNDDFWIEGTYRYTLQVTGILLDGFGLERMTYPTEFVSGMVDESASWTRDKELAGGRLSWGHGDKEIADMETWRSNFSLEGQRAETFFLSNSGVLHLDRGQYYSRPTDLGSVFNLVYPDQLQLSLGKPRIEAATIPSGVIFVEYHVNAISDRYATMTAVIQPCKAAETLEPYKYLIDLKTGRPVTASGCVRMFLGDNHVDIRFDEIMQNWMMRLMLNRT